MNLTADIVRLIQKKIGFTGKDVDGRMGPGTDKALMQFIKERKDNIEDKFVSPILHGSRKRKATALGQLVCQEHEIDAGPIDGLLGTQSTHAFEELLFKIKHGRTPHPWRDYNDIPNPNNWPGSHHQQLVDFYGDPGNKGKNVPLKSVKLPYTHLLAWDMNKKIKRLKCHEKVADSMERVLTEVVEHYGEQGIKELGLDIWGGCFNFRKKRGGSTLSTHSWGISVDYHPEKNRLRWGWDKAVFARPDYDFWWEAWEKEGWVGLGRVQNFDWMHIQACRIPRLMLPKE